MMKLYTAATPNGYKASVALEEMGFDYEFEKIDLTGGVQKQDWFLEINPNGRIPALVHDDFPIFELGAIMLYLARLSGKFYGTDAKSQSRVEQWLMFQMGGIGPMMGQANVFYRYFPEKISARDRPLSERRPPPVRSAGASAFAHRISRGRLFDRRHGQLVLGAHAQMVRHPDRRPAEPPALA